MKLPRVLFVSHSRVVSGAERVLLDIVEDTPSASAFVFEDGELAESLRSRGAAVQVSRYGRGFSAVRRDGKLLATVPLTLSLGALAIELSTAARRHDVVYANSQKAMTAASLASVFVRRPLIWHLHDLFDGSHFGATQRRLQIGLANRSAHTVIVPSDACARAFVASGGRPGLVPR